MPAHDSWNSIAKDMEAIINQFVAATPGTKITQAHYGPYGGVTLHRTAAFGVDVTLYIQFRLRESLLTPELSLSWGGMSRTTCEASVAIDLYASLTRFASFLQLQFPGPYEVNA